jgi:hypothetical protein
VGGVHPGGADPGVQGDPERVRADGTQEHRVAAGPGRGDRLVGALAAGHHQEVVAEHRLARGRQPRGDADEVHVGAAGHHDPRRH